MGQKPTAKQKAFTEAVVGGETHSAAYHTEAERVESTTEADLIDMLQKRLVGIIPQPIEIEKIEVEEKDDPTPP